MTSTSPDQPAYDVSERLRERSWIVPAYQFLENRQNLHVLRVVVRNGSSRQLADHFLGHVERLVPELEKQAQRPLRRCRAGSAMAISRGRREAAATPAAAPAGAPATPEAPPSQ